MIKYEDLIVPIGKDVRLPEEDKELFTDGKTVRLTKPLVSIGGWQRYQLVREQFGELDLALELVHPTSRTEFLLNISAEVRLSEDEKKQSRLVKLLHNNLQHHQASVGKLLKRAILRDLNSWTNTKSPTSRLLSAVLDSIATRDQGMADVDRSVQRVLRDYGYETSFVRIQPAPVKPAPGSISIREEKLAVRLSDHDQPLSVLIDGELRPKTGSDSYYTSKLPATGGDSIQSRVIEAIRQELGGTRLQHWKERTNFHDDHLIEMARVAGNREAARYGWTLSKGLLLRSDIQTVLLSQNFVFEESYKLPGVGRKLTIAHSGSYKLVDAARFEQFKRTQPECRDFQEFVKQQAQRITERQLQRGSYAKAIALLDNASELESEIATELADIVCKYGHESISCHVVVKNLPEMELLSESGYRGELFGRKQEFSLGVHNRNANIGVSACLKLRDAAKLEPWLSIDDNMSNIVGKVAERAKSVVASFLNKIEPNDFRLSDLNAGEDLDEDKSIEHIDPFTNEREDVTIHAFQRKLKSSIASEISSVFGIELTDIEFIRGEEPVKNREEELRDYKAEVLIEKIQVLSEYDHQLHDVDVKCLYIIKKPAKAYEQQFASSALALTKEKQIAELERTLRIELENLVKASRYELFRGQYLPKLAHVFEAILSGAAQRHHGLDIVIDPSALRTSVPPAVETRELSGLNMQIENLKGKRIRLLGDLEGDGDEDEKTMEQIERLGRQIRKAEELRDDIRTGLQDESVDRDALAALPKVLQAITAHTKSMALPDRSRALVEKQVQLLEVITEPKAATVEPKSNAEQNAQEESDPPVVDGEVLTSDGDTELVDDDELPNDSTDRSAPTAGS